ARLVVHRRIDDAPSRSLLTRWKYRQGRFVCVSEAVEQVLARWGVPNHRLHHIPSSLPLPEDCPSRSREELDGPVQLLCVGALVHHKGHKTLLDAMALQSESCELLLVGAGLEEARLRRQVERLGLVDRVRFERSFERLPALLESADVFVHPSLSEGLGTAVLEAMGAGLPVVAARVGGLPELVEDRVTGWLVEPGEPAQLAATLDHVIALRRERPAELTGCGYRGWRRARERFPMTHMVGEVQRVYDVLP
ncbi:MAG: hypothetical protein CL928_18090, partial [Deltaproteobacteria bacterium]|nr:hypothetical protein [Deltaproteobacteria bacterium]